MDWWFWGLYLLFILAFIPLWMRMWNRIDPHINDDYMIGDDDPDRGDKS
jgi:hypothetical protein